VLHKTYRELDNIFTDREAWFLFRWSAFLETFGWTLLLIGILFQVNKWPGDTWLLPVGGSLHGMFVLAYMMITFFIHRSITPTWSIKKLIVAEVISIIPYGALAFELWVAHGRKRGRHG
jgi:integral membrane protein